MERFIEKDEFGGNKLVFRCPERVARGHNEYWCVETSQDGTMTIRGEAIEKLAEYEDLEEQVEKFNPILEGFTTYELKRELRRRKREGSWFRWILWRMGKWM